MEKKTNKTRILFVDEKNQLFCTVIKNFNINQICNFIQQNKTILTKHKRYNFERWIVSEMNYSYDAKFEGNILKVGRTGFCKTTYVQSLGKNKMFGEIKVVIWEQKMPLSKDRKNDTRECFVDKELDFKYRNNIDEFDDLLDYFQTQKHHTMKII